MERPFEKVALGRLSHGAVAVQITIPLAILLVGEVGICPLADLTVAVEILVAPVAK